MKPLSSTRQWARLVVSLTLSSMVTGFAPLAPPWSSAGAQFNWAPARAGSTRASPAVFCMSSSTESEIETTEEQEHTELVSVRTQLRPPYLSLKKMYMGDGEAGANIYPEQPRGPEVVPISASEAARHLSALTSAAVSQRDPEPGGHYYMPKGFHLQRLEDQAPDAVAAGGEQHGTKLIGTARARQRDAPHHEATAEAILFGNEKAIYGAEAQFLAVPAHELSSTDRVSNVLADKPSRASPHYGANPYTRLDEAMPLVVDTHHLRHLKAHARFDSELCQGHFVWEYPALPVAVVWDRGVCAALALLRAMGHLGPDGKDRVIVRDLKAATFNLAFAPDLLNLRANLVHSEEGEPLTDVGGVHSIHKVRVEVTTAEEVELCEMGLQLEVLPAHKS